MPRTLTVGANFKQNWRSRFFLRHCLLLVLRRSSLFFAARHTGNDRAGGDRAAGVSDVLFYALRPTFIPAAASVTGAVCQWHHDDSIIFLMCRFYITFQIRGRLSYERSK